MAHDAGDPRNRTRELCGALNRPEGRVEDMIPVVRPERLALLVAKFDLGPEGLERRGHVLPAERMGLHGHPGLRPEAGREARPGGDHHATPRRPRGESLPGTSGAPAL